MTLVLEQMGCLITGLLPTALKGVSSIGIETGLGGPNNECASLTAQTNGLFIGGNASSGLGFWDATPTIQPTATTDLKTAMSLIGLCASSTTRPINVDGGILGIGATSDVILTGNFASDANWTKGSGWTIAGGVGVATGAISTDLSQTVAPCKTGRTYKVTFTVATVTAGTITPTIGTQAGTARSIVGTYTENITANGTGFKFATAGFTGTIDNVSAYEIDVPIKWNTTYLAGGSGMWSTAPSKADANYLSKCYEFEEDFIVPFRLGAADDMQTLYTVEAGAGAATETFSTTEVGGVLVITNDAADNDADQIVWSNRLFKLAAGKTLWWECRAKLSDATQSDLFLGLIAPEDMTAVADNMPQDGVGFLKDDGDTQIDYVSSKDGANDAQTNKGTMDTSYHTYGLLIDGVTSVTPYLDGVALTALATTFCDDELLAPTVMVRNGEAVAKILSVDYIRCVQLR